MNFHTNLSYIKLVWTVKLLLIVVFYIIELIFLLVIGIFTIYISRLLKVPDLLFLLIVGMIVGLSGFNLVGNILEYKDFFIKLALIFILIKNGKIY